MRFKVWLNENWQNSVISTHDLKPTPTRFMTSQGSVYELHPDGTTTRTKSLHVYHSPTDVGVKARSLKTLYLEPSHAHEVGFWGSSSASGKRVVHSGNQITLLSINPKTEQLGRDGIFPVTDRPEIGKSPLELWDFQKEKWKEGSYRNSHPGNPITKII